MPVVLMILKVLLALLAVLLLLLAAALLLPLGFAVEYRAGRFRLKAVYGPLRRTFWSFHLKRPAAPAGGRPRPAASGRASRPGSASPPPDSAPAAPAAEPVPAEEEETPQIPAGAIGRVERVLTLLEDDPQALLHCAWEHMRWLDRHSFFKVRVRHLNVFWTVTCEDASRTAIAYGAALSALNTALAAVQQMLHLQSDRLCLEPDFTGQRRKEREISFTVSACAALMFHLLYRIWKDPLLQPAPRESTV
ncbi:MAG TPA: hypothetical protein H9724_06380 [Candidatus Gemmiger avistercoris]|uniref:DUF2953 domain-containing protein n=1 Tax=Candidatus Gemmiger avistercoris TaxID=2838606 RepID=A0A9D2JPH7_9FIRM|nr:hypothetical protein [Candidatus Gemmiger avistercoris]